MMHSGLKVRMTQGSYPFWSAGDTAVLAYADSDGSWWADFNGHGNHHVEDDGVWCIAATGDDWQFFQKYDHDDPEEVLA